MRSLVKASDRMVFDGDSVAVRRSEAAVWFKLRDWEADDVLTRRYDQAWGEVVEHRPAVTFTSRAEVTSHGADGPIPDGRRVFEVPARFLRCYRNVHCTARQVVQFGDYVLPDSWRHPHQRVLNNRQLERASSFFGYHLDRTAPIAVRELPGAYYYLDTELPGHFGHITTDVVSRVWGWRRAAELEPDLKALVSVSAEPRRLPGFQQTIFTALGIPADRVEIIGPREQVRVERLYGPTPQLENPTYIDPDIAEVWAELGAKLPAGVTSTSEKIFVSRRPGDKRHCRETPGVETFFAEQGFRILFPEDHSYTDQKTIFSSARVIAGLGGSGMFNMMFAPGARVILISGTSYNAENEHLIAAANGNELHYFWGPSDIAMPQNFSLTAFRSDFSFDVRRHRRELLRLL